MQHAGNIKPWATVIDLCWDTATAIGQFLQAEGAVHHILQPRFSHSYVGVLVTMCIDEA